MNIALLGVGLMGFPMGQRLCRAGHAVRAWNRTVEKARRLEPLGAGVATSPAEAVAGAELAIVMLENGPAVAQVLFGQAPITELFAALYAAGVRHGLAELDHAALFLELDGRSPARALHDHTARAWRGAAAPFTNHESTP